MYEKTSSDHQVAGASGQLKTCDPCASDLFKEEDSHISMD